MADKARTHILIEGRVQGVLFREKCRKKAGKLGVLGWVKNLEDGRVEAVFEGDKEKVEKLVKWAERGPFFARVDSISTEWENYKGEFKDFEIRYDI